MTIWSVQVIYFATFKYVRSPRKVWSVPSSIQELLLEDACKLLSWLSYMYAHPSKAQVTSPYKVCAWSSHTCVASLKKLTLQVPNKQESAKSEALV